MRSVFIVLALILGAFSATANAQGAKDVARLFAKLEARLEVGLSYRDYTNALGDLNYDFNAYLKGPEAIAAPELRSALSMVMLRHLEAQRIWNITVQRGGIETLYTHNEFAKSLLARYPDAAKEVKDGGALFRSTTETLSLKHILPFLWRDAGDNLKQAMVLIAQ